MPLVPVLTPTEATSWDNLSIGGGRSLSLLMQSAGRALAQLSLEHFGRQARRGVLIAAGPGNNGGDGWVMAQALHALDLPVWVAAVGEAKPGPAATARELALADGVRTVSADGPWPGVGLLVDALLGTGAHGAPLPAMAAVLARMIDLQLPILAVDGPTGLDLCNGTHFGDLRADLSITFGGVRRGHLLARDESGAVIVADIGLGRCPLPVPWLVDAEWAAAQLPPFPANAHKGVRGRVVVIGGAPGMLGAARLACHGALTAGAGLLHLVTAPESLSEARIAEPEVQVTSADFDAPPNAELCQLLGRADAVVLGPGLGRAAGRTDFVLGVIRESHKLLLDADALYAISEPGGALKTMAANRSILCTPHLGEFRRLFPEWSSELAVAPWDAAHNAAQDAGVGLLLKGVPTVLAGGGEWLTVSAGNPGLATGGSGDVLAGVAGTLLAQGLTPVTAGAVATQGLGDAADLVATRLGTRAMRPHDVLECLPEIWQSWSELRPIRRFPVLWECGISRE